MTLEEFIEKYLGTKVDVDGVYQGQCVDLYRYYVDKVLGYPQSQAVGGAADIWYTAQQQYYDFIDNDPYAIPKRGDIVIWNRNVGGGFGHVAIFIKGDVNTFKSLDQNWPTLNKITITGHDYNNVKGWLRPKKEVDVPKTMKITKKLFNKIRDNSEKWDKVHKELNLEEDPAKTPFSKAQSAIGGLRSRETELKKKEKEIEELEDRLSTRKKQLIKEQNLRKTLNSKLNQANQKYSEIQGEYEGRIEELQGTIKGVENQRKNLREDLGKLEMKNVRLKKKVKILEKGQAKKISFGQALKIVILKFKELVNS